ncbi:MULTISPECIES: ChaN family lipoprotein [unclassified Pseudomonas]|uniref:ChaN family lipoprotein n=1 Tax=unclassified Pseudomonas TaxID=196821 RepID=UPI00244869F1|nr:MULTISPECIES: ChaN family lipoprotein [unclassified Pseudomonas]MDH0897520.1 ChaN family lipoprotein [Pseudomonas sp. GD03875]MDH1067513.1 ChaN family lipoprotein [Pseudomonas sp. GD03985]
MRILLLCCFCLLAACQSRGVLPPPAPIAPEGRDHARLGQIVELASGARISPEQLVERLAAAPRVLVGEQHDNPDHHALQLWLSRELAARRPQGSVLMEMIGPGQQAAVDRAQAETRAGRPPADAYAALDWQAGWDWGLYGALVQYQLRQPYPLLAANLERAEIMDIYRQRPALEGPASSAPAVQEKLEQDIRESHCGLLPDSQIPAMLAVQQQRDRRMARRLAEAPQPAMLLAGAFHVHRDLGVPLHLSDLGAGAGNAVLILAEVGREPAPGSADYVWYTAANPPEDHCAKLRR